MWDAEGDGVRAVLRWSGMEEIVPGEVGWGWCREGGLMDGVLTRCRQVRSSQ